MRKKADYARQIKNLWTRLKKEGGKVDLAPVEDPMEQLLKGILSTFAAESRAEAALGKLHASVVDLNELRVTPIAEIVETIGVDYPMCRAAAEEISRALNAVFNRIHGLNLDFLKTSSRRAAETFLNSLDGVGPYAKATVVLRCLNGHVIPVDMHMHAFLKKNACIPEGAAVGQAQRLLTRTIRGRDGPSFYVLLKRHAAAHAPRKAPTRRPADVGKPAAGKAPPRKAASKGEARPAKTAAKTKAARKTTRAREGAATRKGATAPSARAEKALGRQTGKKMAASSKRAGTKKVPKKP